ncbi:MAG: hypothetical protein ABIV47_05480 [Roseiflexaceae bacterium]
MNRPNRPAYWQLDIFVVAMIGLVVAMLRAHLSSSWEIGAEIAWATLMIAGMGMWMRANRVALKRSDDQERAAAVQRVPRLPEQGARTLPLTPVQQRYLAVMEHIDTDDRVVVHSK